MVAAPPVKDYFPIFYLLQIGNAAGLSRHFPFGVHRKDIMVGREEIEVVAVDGLAVRQMPVAAGLGVNRFHRMVMSVEQDAHAGVVTRESPVGEGRVRGVVAVVGLAVQDMLLEIPVAVFIHRSIFFAWIEAVEQQTAVVVVFLDEATEDERQVEVSRLLAFSIGHNRGNAAVERIQ